MIYEMPPSLKKLIPLPIPAVTHRLPSDLPKPANMTNGYGMCGASAAAANAVSSCRRRKAVISGSQLPKTLTLRKANVQQFGHVSRRENVVFREILEKSDQPVLLALCELSPSGASTFLNDQ
jgi:hypothetical protein